MNAKRERKKEKREIEQKKKINRQRERVKRGIFLEKKELKQLT